VALLRHLRVEESAASSGPQGRGERPVTSSVSPLAHRTFDDQVTDRIASGFQPGQFRGFPRHGFGAFGASPARDDTSSWCHDVIAFGVVFSP
jgi:hypothetical protein